VIEHPGISMYRDTAPTGNESGVSYTQVCTPLEIGKGGIRGSLFLVYLKIFSRHQLLSRVACVALYLAVQFSFS
jgi:hypothetical protein